MRNFAILTLLPLLVLAAPSQASVLKPPSQAVVKSCLEAGPQPGVGVVEIPTREINQEDDYRPGYSAEYTVFNGAAVGFATSKKSGAIIYHGRLYPITKAILLPGSKDVSRPLVHIELASWMMLKGDGLQYLCASDNFDGVGRSGDFQKIRYGYILEVRKGGQLFFTNGVTD